MDFRPGATFEPEDHNPLGEPDPAAVAQAGQAGYPPPPPPPEFPPGAAGTAVPGYPAPAPPTPGGAQFGSTMEQAPQAPQAPPVNQFGNPVAPGYQSPAAPPVNGFGSPVDPGGQFRSGAKPDVTTPGQGRIGTPGAVSATDQVRTWNSGRPVRPSLAADRALFAGVAAGVLFVFVPFSGFGGLFTTSALVVVFYASAIYAIVHGHRGLREVRRGATGKGKAIAGLVLGYTSASLMTIGIVLAVLAIASIVNAFGNISEQFEPPPEIDTVQPVSAFALDPGNCLLSPDDTWARYGGEDWQFQVVPCDRPHLAEVVYVDDNPFGAYPTGEETDTVAIECETAATRYMGVSADDDLWFWNYYYSDEREWQAGGGYVVCTVETWGYAAGSIAP